VHCADVVRGLTASGLVAARPASARTRGDKMDGRSGARPRDSDCGWIGEGRRDAEQTATQDGGKDAADPEAGGLGDTGAGQGCAAAARAGGDEDDGDAGGGGGGRRRL
jgi:hypothetical protein